jgi:hypothetical protein
MATYTINGTIGGTAQTQDVVVGDTINFNVTGLVGGGSINNGTPSNCTITVTNQATANGTETGTLTNFAVNAYSIAWSQTVSKTTDFFILTGDVTAAATTDGVISVSVANDQQSSTETGDSVVTISDGNATTDYRVLITSTGTGQAIGTQAGPTRTGNGTINIPSNRQPTVGNVVSYKTQFADVGGSNWADCTGTNPTFTIGRINNFTFQDINPAGINQQYIRTVQVNGLRKAYTASKLSGFGDFAVNSSSSSTGATFNTTNKTITNGQYIHARMTSSSIANTPQSETIRVFGTSLVEDDAWTVTTGNASYSISAPASINEGSAGTINVTTSGVPNSTTLYWDLDQSSDYTTSLGTVVITSNAGSFSITPLADSQTEGPETDTVRLYTDSGRTNEVANDSFTINDTSTGGSGGSGSGSSDGNQAYGINVYWADGSTIIWSSNLTQKNGLVIDTPTIAGGATQSYTGIADATSTSKIGVDVVLYGIDASTDSFSVSRTTANGGTISITNDTAGSLSPDIIVYRIA